MGVVLHYSYVFISLYLFLSEKLSVPSVFIRSASTSHMQRLRGLRRCKVLGEMKVFMKVVVGYVCLFLFLKYSLVICLQPSECFLRFLKSI